MQHMPHRTLGAIALAASILIMVPTGNAMDFEFQQQPSKVVIKFEGTPVATYDFDDAEITRPYFANVKTTSGIQVTRNHPPVGGRDVADHPTFHPGIWLAFGDLSGSDYWRLKAPVHHQSFVQPQSKHGFAVHNRYLAQQDHTQVLCEEVARFTFHPYGTDCSGYFLLWDSTFHSDRSFYFGDQEEMGLGIRVATPLRVESQSDGAIPAGTGEIRDSEGRRNGDQIWGNTADWADYSGQLDGKHVGITLFCHPDNFRPSWFHARDYGLLEANPFGRKAFGKGPQSKLVVEPGASLRLRFGILVHENDSGSSPNLADAYREYLRLTGSLQ